MTLLSSVSRAWSTDRVEHDAGALSSSDFVYLLQQILFFRCDDILGACGRELLPLRTRTCERDRLRPNGIGDLDCGKPHAALCAGNDHRVLCRDLRIFDQRAIRRDEHHPN
jgi:hypothetical protein